MSKPKLGPQGLRILDLLRQRGPLTPREVGAALHPRAGTVQIGKGRGASSQVGSAARGAGSLMGHMYRAGWLKRNEGERFSVAYELTALGEEAMAAHVAEVDAFLRVEVHEKLPAGWRRCRLCCKGKPLAKFHRDIKGRSGYQNKCALCHLEAQRARRGSRLMARDTNRGYTRSSKELLIYRLERLVQAARKARRLGTWRGRPAFRAYVELGEVLEELGNKEDATHVASISADPNDATPPDHAPPSDTNWDPKIHGFHFRSLQ